MAGSSISRNGTLLMNHGASLPKNCRAIAVRLIGPKSSERADCAKLGSVDAASRADIRPESQEGNDPPSKVSRLAAVTSSAYFSIAVRGVCVASPPSRQQMKRSGCGKIEKLLDALSTTRTSFSLPAASCLLGACAAAGRLHRRRVLPRTEPMFGFIVWLESPVAAGVVFFTKRPVR